MSATKIFCFAVLLAGFTVQGTACTIFCATNRNAVLVGNNEDGPSKFAGTHTGKESTKFVTMGPGLHVTSNGNGAGIYYEAKDAQPNQPYSVMANFRQTVAWPNGRWRLAALWTMWSGFLKALIILATQLTFSPSIRQEKPWSANGLMANSSRFVNVESR